MNDTNVKAEMVECPRCCGEGEEYPVTPVGAGIIPEPGTCTLCAGYGEVLQQVRRGYLMRGGPRRG